ncbi:MAG: JDVT-CTERM system glutamic-type intramembrane protease [Gammaproteobacteria bacterium]|nr:JDVT-CTERM system glutamic-type intramembrane protease [Gammaproteobacteria bacterium]
MFSRLARDPLFWFACLAAIILWIILNVFGDAVFSFESPKKDSTTFLLMVVLIYPLLEELAFRGWLQGQLLRLNRLSVTLWLVSSANVLTSIVFAGVHIVAQHAMLAGLVFFPSLVFGLFRERYDSVLPSILLHAFYNFGWFLWVV